MSEVRKGQPNVRTAASAGGYPREAIQKADAIFGDQAQPVLTDQQADKKSSFLKNLFKTPNGRRKLAFGVATPLAGFGALAGCSSPDSAVTGPVASPSTSHSVEPTSSPSAPASPEAPKAKYQDFHLLPGAKVVVDGSNIVIPAGATDNHPEGAIIPLAGVGLVLKSDAKVSTDINADPANQGAWVKMYDEGAGSDKTGSVAFYVPGSNCNIGAFALNTPFDGGNLEVVPLNTIAQEFDEAVGHTHNPGGHSSVLEYDMGQGGKLVGTDLTAADILAKLAKETAPAKYQDFHLLPGAKVVVKGDTVYIPAGVAEGHPEAITVPLSGSGMVLKSDAKFSYDLNADPANQGAWVKMYDEGGQISEETGSVAFFAPGAKCGGTGESFAIYTQWGGNLELTPSQTYSVELSDAVNDTKNPGGHIYVQEYDMAQGGKLVATV